MITDFLEFSRFEAAECKPVLSPFNIAASVRKHIEIAKVEAEKKEYYAYLRAGETETNS